MLLLLLYLFDLLLLSRLGVKGLLLKILLLFVGVLVDSIEFLILYVYLLFWKYFGLCKEKK